jgi:hypothetical protein
MSNGSPVTLNYSGSLSVVTNPILEKQKLCAYPVPANDKLSISFEKLTEDAQLEIYNSLGAKIKSFQLTAGTDSKELDFSNLPVGTYSVFVISKTGTQVCKIIHVH